MTKSTTFETDFGVVALSTKQLQQLGTMKLNFVLASSLIMNDIRFYWSLMARSPIDEVDPDIRALQLLRWVWCSRKLASVIVESDQALGKLVGQLESLKTISESSPRISRENNKSPFKNLAQQIRNKAAYHYNTETLGARLDTFDPSAMHRLFAHPQGGNSISEFAEQIYTMPLLREAGHTYENGLFDKWLKECSRSILTFCEKSIAAILNNSIPEVGYIVHTYEIQNEAQSASHRWPLFLVVDDQETAI